MLCPQSNASGSFWQTCINFVKQRLNFSHFENTLISWSLNDFPKGTPHRIDVDSTWILRRYVEDQISMNFQVISTYVFDVISLIEKCTLLPRTFFDIIFNEPISIKIWDLQPPTLKKELLQVIFLGIYRTTTLPHNFWRATFPWSYPCKKVINHYYKKLKERFSTKKDL